MRYVIDHDLHIHSKLSSCSKHPEQTTENILKYALKNGLNTICITDHYWDSEVSGASDWYEPQNYEHISQSKPLPQHKNVKFLFGCETDMDKLCRIGIPPSRFDDFDFIIISTTHLHMKGFTIDEGDFDSIKTRALLWEKRLDALLDMPLPFHKIGIPHIACDLINPNSRKDYLDTLNCISDAVFERIFTKIAKLGCGVEINYADMLFTDDESETVLRPFKIAKKCGCKFYLGSDGHRPVQLIEAIISFNKAIDMLELTEDDKFILKYRGNYEGKMDL